MSYSLNREPMLEMFLFETNQLLEQLEQSVLNSEKTGEYQSSINEIFRIMHNIKSSSAMMLFNNISVLAHAVEDLFYFLREEKPANVDYSQITDLVLAGVDFIKNQIALIEKGEKVQGEADDLIAQIRQTLAALKGVQVPEIPQPEAPASEKYYVSSSPTPPKQQNAYDVVIFFQEDCQMENVRAFTVVHKLKEISSDIVYFPEDIVENDSTSEMIQKNGFQVSFFSEKNLSEIEMFFQGTAFLKEVKISQLNSSAPQEAKNQKQEEKKPTLTTSQQSFISVNVRKIDELLDLVGELVVAEAMVTQNPELKGMNLDSFHKSARQLKKISHELQDIVMSMRMVPLTNTLQKMNRLVRDMSRKIGKEVELEIKGQDTEVDKNIIEHISDPLLHLIRNALDHGIETPEERIKNNKSSQGKIILEAKNAGGDVWIIIKDDGKGLSREKILQKARTNGLLNKSEQEMTDQEVYSLIFLPGFSTKEQVTEFSGRGVGMDVVLKNIEKLGGTIQVASKPGQGTTFSIKIPLTLAIIEGMTIKVGQSSYTVPITAIQESFRAQEGQVILDPEGQESILVRGICYPILRLHHLYKVETSVNQIHHGILMMVESDGKTICLFADQLVGQQQVVVKALPVYIKKVQGLAGCTLLGDGSISLILDIAGLVNWSLAS